jgi:hypothetical protein
MMLPIDYRLRPIKPKYLHDETESTASWFIFGEYPDGTVGICDGDRDIFEYVPRDVAERIVKARNDFVDTLVALCQ